jgi:hypothetical protein
LTVIFQRHIASCTIDLTDAIDASDLVVISSGVGKKGISAKRRHLLLSPSACSRSCSMADYTIPDGWGTSPSSSTSPAATSPLPKQQSTLDLSEFDPFSETPASPPPPPPAEDPALSTPAKPESRSKPSTTEPRAETPQQQQTPSTSVISSIAATFKRTTVGSGEKKKAREEGSTGEGSGRGSVEEEKRSSSEQAGGKGVEGSKRPAVKPKPAPQFDFPKVSPSML